jgi:2-dehydro-3-deoxyglucarate aldolase/4-hydroxy-2-oxoheptanedioate aldolase
MLDGPNLLKQQLARKETALGLWVTLEAPSITEIAVALGFDWVLIDAEHGHLDFKEILEHLRVTRHTKTTPLVRIQEIEQGLIKRVLDIGAKGIMIPQVESAQDVEQAIRFAKYPPWGIRGVGGERATRWGMGLKACTQMANQEVMVIPLIETVAAAQNMDSILAVKGIDAVYFGPADLSSSSGFLGEWEGPGIAEQVLSLLAKVRARGLAAGIMAKDPANAQLRQQQGFQMLALGSDTGFLIRSASEALRALGRTLPAN